MQSTREGPSIDSTGEGSAALYPLVDATLNLRVSSAPVKTDKTQPLIKVA